MTFLLPTRFDTVLMFNGGPFSQVAGEFSEGRTFFLRRSHHQSINILSVTHIERSIIIIRFFCIFFSSSTCKQLISNETYKFLIGFYTQTQYCYVLKW